MSLGASLEVQGGRTNVHACGGRAEQALAKSDDENDKDAVAHNAVAVLGDMADALDGIGQLFAQRTFYQARAGNSCGRSFPASSSALPRLANG